MITHILRVENLSLKREGRDILYRVNLAIQPGEVHGLLGLNGSGKSSLAYAIMGCSGYTPNEGHIWFNGQDITHMPITERARLGLTLAWQEPARFEGLPVGAYLSLGTQERDRNHLAAALEAVALAPLAYLRRPVNHALSGGERKRIELAAVFAMRPKLAILDEPDSGVDTLSLGDIAVLIRRMADQGTALLLITHRDEMVTVVRGQATARNMPLVVVRDDRAHVTHEAAIGTVNRKELETLIARGLDEEIAVDVIIRGMLQ